jgi:hypothetical protein
MRKRSLDNSLSERMFGGRLGGCRNGEQLLFAYACHGDFAHHGTAFGERARFVEHNLRDQPETLEGLTGPHQDAVLRGLTGAAHDRERRGDADGAGITHHQNAQAGED